MDIRCAKHPRYKALRFPTSDCLVCKEIFMFLNRHWNRAWIQTGRMMVK